jgi:hypothetical protein
MAAPNILDSVRRQYGASLAMLRQAIEACPESLWLSPEFPNRFWHIAYHALHYTRFYLQPTEADFHPWAKHQQDSQHLSPPKGQPKIETPYTKLDVLELHELCCAEVEAKVPWIDLEAPSGFPWLPFNKLELQFYNIRHIQHHTGQLADRTADCNQYRHPLGSSELIGDLGRFAEHVFEVIGMLAIRNLNRHRACNANQLVRAGIRHHGHAQLRRATRHGASVLEYKTAAPFV